MFFSARNLSALFAFVVLWIIIYHEELGSPSSEASLDHLISSTPPKTHISKDDFISQASSAAIEDDFDDSHLSRMCKDQLWDDDVVFTCRGIIGGIGNIRQEILHCVRYAIDAGAGLIVPVINIRSENNLSDLKNGTASMDYLFDQDRFVSRLKTACPRMPIYKDLEELKVLGSVTETAVLILEDIPHWFKWRAYSARTKVRELKAPLGQITLIPFEHVWQYFPICHDSIGFANTFGNLLPFRQDVHRLAATILYELYSSYHLEINPSIATTSPLARSFLGIHLRTAYDILPEWLNYKDQAGYYLSHMDDNGFIASLSAIYIASGNATSISDFSKKVDTLGQTKPILTKQDLLTGEDLAELNSLTWDQQALIDLLVLNRSGFFMGMADSTFAWTTALDRRKTSKEGSCGYRKSEWKSKLWGTAFRDEFSDLMGNHAYGWEDRMWP